MNINPLLLSAAICLSACAPVVAQDMPEGIGVLPERETPEHRSFVAPFHPYSGLLSIPGDGQYTVLSTDDSTACLTTGISTGYRGRIVYAAQTNGLGRCQWDTAIALHEHDLEADISHNYASSFWVDNYGPIVTDWDLVFDGPQSLTPIDLH